MDDHTELRSAIWERAAKAKPQDHALQMRWFTFGYEAGDWKSAQKVSGKKHMLHWHRIKAQVANECLCSYYRLQ